MSGNTSFTVDVFFDTFADVTGLTSSDFSDFVGCSSSNLTIDTVNNKVTITGITANTTSNIFSFKINELPLKRYYVLNQSVYAIYNGNNSTVLREFAYINLDPI